MELMVEHTYKQSEVGKIPVDWKVELLDDLSEKITVGIASAATHAYRTTGIILFRNQNIKPNYLDDSDILYISIDYENAFKNKRLKAGDLLTSRTGYPGTTCVVPNKYIGAQSFTTLIIRPDSNKVDSVYLSYYINAEVGQSFFETNQIGGGQKNVNAATLKLLPIALPPTKGEQITIATTLSDTDVLINGLEKLIEKKRNIKQGAMQELLRPRNGWDVKKLGDIGESIIGLTYIPSNIVDDGILVLRSSNIQDNKLKYNDNVFVDVQVNEKLKTQKGDILVCVRNGSRNLIGKCAYIDGRAVGETFGAFMAIFRSRYNNFIFHVFQSNIIKRQIDEHIGATINQITNKSMNSFEIPFPPMDEQNKISSILFEMDSEIEALERKLAKYREVKQGMMQVLLTGKVRLV
jgi:type I restriction enzyme S subunit